MAAGQVFTKLEAFIKAGRLPGSFVPKTHRPYPHDICIKSERATKKTIKPLRVRQGSMRSHRLEARESERTNTRSLLR